MKSARQLWRQGLQQASAWLPVFMMLQFALGTWWLVRNTPRPAPPAPAAPAEQPDYYMRDFSVRTFDAQGRLTARISGQQGRHLLEGDWLHVSQPRIVTIDAQGQSTEARAERAVAKGDGSEAELFDQVLVQRPAFTPPNGPPQPALSYSGAYLHAFIDQERVQSDQPVRITRGPDTFSGNRFEYDKRQGRLQLHGQVRGTIAPASAR